ncbi:MAG TPA: NAD(P)-binding protein, partial [bacterium]|nr:NAD(P)-binding protein [bacterium]
MFNYIIIGAGFAGSVIAERIASVLNKKVLIVEKR